jgi:hypothetical protein
LDLLLVLCLTTFWAQSLLGQIILGGDIRHTFKEVHVCMYVCMILCLFI